MKKLLVFVLLAGWAGSLFALDTSKKLEIKVAVWDVQSAFADANDPVLKYVQDKFNVTFKPAAMGWDDWQAKLNLWAASGDMPDIATIADRNIELKFIKQGVIRALPSDLSAYPTLKALFAQSDVKPLAVNGKFYQVPRQGVTEEMQGFGSDRTIIVRKDWMLKAGFKTPPTTFEDFLKMGKAFADPSKGVSGIAVGFGGGLMGLFEPEAPAMLGAHWSLVGGKWVPPTMTPAYIRALTQISRLYNEGALDPDTFILKDKEGMDRFAQGKAGVLIYNGGPSHLKMLYDRWKTYPNNPDFASTIIQIPSWKNSDGKVYRTEMESYWSSNIFSAKMDDVKMARVLAILDWFRSEEGLNLNTYGLEGVDYKKDGSKMVITREKDATTGLPVSLGKKYPSISSMFTHLAIWSADVTMWRKDEANYAAYGVGPLDIAMESQQWRKANTTLWKPNWDIYFLDYPEKDKFSRSDITNQDTIKLILDKQDPVTAWPKVIEKYRAQGLDKIIETVNSRIKK